MKLKNEELWKEIVAVNNSEMGQTVVEFSQTWAELMEIKIDNGLSLESIAKEMSDIADNTGITGAMYSFSVKILSDCWIYGEALRNWHNGKKLVSLILDGVIDSSSISIPLKDTVK